MLDCMKRLALTAAATYMLLAGCASSRGTASIIDATAPEGPGFEGIQTMNACVTETEECYPLEIESDGAAITRIHYPIDIWVDVTESGCSHGYCWATDGNGAEWKLEP